MSSPVLRGGDMAVTETAIRDAVRQVLLPLWNVWYFFTLYANADGYTATPADRLDAPARPLRAGQDARAGRDDVSAQLDALRHLGRLRDRAVLPGRADQLVRAPLAGPVLVRRPGRVRHAVHGAGDALPGGGAARAAGQRGDLARADRRAVGAPDRLAGRRRSSRPTTSWWPRWTPCATVCSAALSCARPSGLRVRLPLPRLTVATRRPRRAAAVRRPGRRRGQRQGGGVHRRRGRVLRAGADRGAAGARPAGRQARCSR